MVASVLRSGLEVWWAPALAFLGGAISFASPCCLPLVPGYVSFVSGEAVAQVDAEGNRKVALAPILLFIAGFTLVFTLLGWFTANMVEAGFQVLRGRAGRLVAGSLVVAVGLLMIGFALQRGRLAFYVERRPFLAKVKPGPKWAFPVGMAFAAGWTPCIGPTLAGILALAGMQGGGARGALLLVCYSLGLGLPFLLVGLGVQRSVGAFTWIRRNYRSISVVSGAFLVGVGVMIATGAFWRLFAPLARYAPRL